MSLNKNRHEAMRWLQTAQEDLQAAKVLRDNEMYAHACFLAQQSGEKSIKAIWHFLDYDPWGHSIQRLVVDFPTPQTIPDINNWMRKAAFLDRFYIPTRYPNGLPDLTPGESYFKNDADQAIETALIFLKFAEEYLKSDLES